MLFELSPIDRVGRSELGEGGGDRDLGLDTVLGGVRKLGFLAANDRGGQQERDEVERRCRSDLVHPLRRHSEAA